jgi:hypothetical protein
MGLLQQQINLENHRSNAAQKAPLKAQPDALNVQLTEMACNSPEP